MVNQKSNIVRNKCGRDILLYNVKYRSTFNSLSIQRYLAKKYVDTNED